nr:hypothetical protein [uncultured Caproiciproducens sp.]
MPSLLPLLLLAENSRGQKELEKILSGKDVLSIMEGAVAKQLRKIEMHKESARKNVLQRFFGLLSWPIKKIFVQIAIANSFFICEFATKLL